MVHDAMKQLGLLRQVLEQDKRPIAVLLGAGCPLAIKTGESNSETPLIPSIVGLTQMISQSLSSDDPAFSVIASSISDSRQREPNIEHILSHVRLLRQVVGVGEIQGLNAESLEQLEIGICSQIVRHVNKQLPTRGGPYHKLANWIGSTNRSHPISIFTTNYDLLIEQALEESGVPYFDGFIGSRNAFFDPHSMERDELPARWARLYKLHGSVNWHQEGRDVWRGDANGSSLIYPSHLKYDQSRRMPYLAMMDQLRSFLKGPGAVLITCGYSFGDEHINDIIVQGLEGNIVATVFGLLYGTLAEYPSILEIAKGRGNLSLIARDGGIIGKRVGGWEPRVKEEFPENPPSIDWEETGGDDPRELHGPKLMLGDFARLAALLEGLSQNSRSSVYV